MHITVELEIPPNEDGLGILHFLLGEKSLIFDVLKGCTPSSNSIITVKISGIVDAKKSLLVYLDRNIAQ